MAIPSFMPPIALTLLWPVLIFCLILKMVFAKPAYNVQLLGAVRPHCVSAAETKARYSLMFTFEKSHWPQQLCYCVTSSHIKESQNIYIYIPALCAWRLIWKCMHWLPWQCCFADVVCSWVFLLYYRQDFKVFQSMIQTFQLFFFFLCKENFWCCWYFGNTTLV